jgi:hypothetical protein
VFGTDCHGYPVTMEECRSGEHRLPDLDGCSSLGRRGDLRPDVPQPSADSGECEPARARLSGPFPRAAQVVGEGSGEAELGVHGDDEPGPLVPGLWVSDPRLRSPQRMAYLAARDEYVLLYTAASDERSREGDRGPGALRREPGVVFGDDVAGTVVAFGRTGNAVMFARCLLVRRGSSRHCPAVIGTDTR